MHDGTDDELLAAALSGRADPERLALRKRQSPAFAQELEGLFALQRELESLGEEERSALARSRADETEAERDGVRRVLAAEPLPRRAPAHSSPPRRARPLRAALVTAAAVLVSAVLWFRVAHDSGSVEDVLLGGGGIQWLEPELGSEGPVFRWEFALPPDGWYECSLWKVEADEPLLPPSGRLREPRWSPDLTAATDLPRSGRLEVRALAAGPRLLAFEERVVPLPGS